MRIGDIQRFSLIDYPGKICATIFTQGCNFRCPYCHNPELVDSSLHGQPLTEEALLAFLEQRRGKLDAVNITGGEPLLQQGLIEFLQQLRGLGYLVKIDTNGSFPKQLREIISEGLLDYVAMDIKAPLERYEEIVKVPVSPDDIEESIAIIMGSGIDYEFRTTLVKNLLEGEDVDNIGRLIKGSRRYVMQKFVPSKTLDPAFMTSSGWTDEELYQIKGRLERFLPSVIIR